MARLSNLKRLIKEDFPEEEQDLIDKVAYSFNPLLEQVVAAFNKGISIENMTREIIDIPVENVAGDLRISTQFKTGLSSRIRGMNVIKAENITNPGTYPTSSPFVSWTISGNIITVQKVTGIQDGNKYMLTLEIIS